jgi:uncharacterized repeat protein (TIGR03803 family)
MEDSARALPSSTPKSSFLRRHKKMLQRKLQFGWRLAIAAALLALIGAGRTQAAAKETVLYTFTGGSDGRLPNSGLVFDSTGNIYGVNQYGQGESSYGNVFELTHSGSRWIETVIYGFSDPSDGDEPIGTLVWDEKGNLFGVTQLGGASSGVGTVFELSPSSGGGWTKSTLYTFSGGSDGAQPIGLISDGKGNLYGITINGGDTSCSCGVVFELKQSKGSWTETVLHTFLQVPDGSNPQGLTLDAGSIYGTTEGGGTYNAGTVFQIKHSGGHWKESILHNFTGGADGDIPFAAVVIDRAGDLYGSTAGGGSGNRGVVFKLKHKSYGKWEEQVLHSFKDNGHDGISPSTALIVDNTGNLYGTTSQGGAYGAGTAFELMQNFDGTWIETVIETFIGPRGGSQPNALALGNDGYLYGTTYAGGAYNAGLVFQLSP